jgi:ABC-2 type transport system permease protein
MNISFPAVLPPSSLGDFAIGHADIQPQSAEISPWQNAASLFGRYQFDNPATLAGGSFDVALVIVLLMPILMIAVSFDVLAADRGRGTLPMIMSFPLRLENLVWTRLLFRNGLLWLAAVATMSFLLVANDAGGDRIQRFAIWLGVCLSYGLFWLSLIAVCVAYTRTAVGAAAALVGTWAVLTLAVPAVIATASESLYPTPSRLALLSEVRTAQGETNRELDRLTEGFLMNHPDLTVSEEEVPAYFRGTYLANEAVREQTTPILAGYERARKGREDLLGAAQFLSPAVIAQRLLHLAAGADLERQLEYQEQARNALDTLAGAVGPAVVSKNRITVPEFDSLQPFRFADRSAAALAAVSGWPTAWLLFLSAVAGFAAHRRIAAKQVRHD